MLVFMSHPAKAPDQTRQTLLEAAFGEIHRNGFQAASLSQILADTGLTKGALYHHFPDKKALGLAVVDEIIGPRLTEMMVAPLQATRKPLSALQALLAEKAAEDDPYPVRLGCPLNNLIQEMSPIDEDFRGQLHAVFQGWVDAIALALQRGQGSGEVRADVDAPSTAFFIVAALEGCVGMSKNTQSVAAYRSCLAQLSGFLDTLRA
jgi:AcrR family transcriptional regulator